MTTKSALTRSVRPEWRDVIVIRSARIAHLCVGRDEFRSHTVTSTWPQPVDGVLSISSTRLTQASAEAHADWARENRPGAEVTISSDPNPNYRPDCLGSIAPGDLYAEYIGEAGFTESGKPYCASCLEVWQ